MPQGIQDLVVVTHPTMARGTASGGFGITLSRREADDAPELARRLGHLAPHLYHGLEVSLRMAPLADERTQLDAVLHAVSCAGLLLDGAGRVLSANAAAEHLLRARDGLEVRSHGGLRLAASLPTETRLLSGRIVEALSCAADPESALSGSLLLSRPSGRAALLVTVVPLPASAFPIWQVTGNPRVLVLVTVPDAPHPVSPETLCAVLGFTLAEARVALKISAGLGVPQAAAVLGLSPSTVKTHLSRCFEKTGLHSQLALARLVSGFPEDQGSGAGS